MQNNDFQPIVDLVRQRAGLALTSDAARLFERRARERLQATGYSSWAEYHRFVRYHPDADEELQHLYEFATNNETYFFREDYQFEAFRDHILPQVVRTQPQRRHLRCWSMGCSSGEEAYSIAMVLLESGLLDDWNVRVYGTDISRRCIATARRGVYGDSSFRCTSPERRDRFFCQTEDGTKVDPSVQRLCQFGQLNLLELATRSTIDMVDAVFCRNVLIYFSPEARRTVISGIFDRLRPGGYLLLGHSESLLNLPTGFEVVHLSRDVVYRKPPLPESLSPFRLGGMER